MAKSTLASRVAWLATLTLLSASRAMAADASGDAPTAVLGMEALEGAPDSVAAEITDALRQRVASTKGFQLVQGKDIVELKLVFACPDEAPACMSQAGKSLGASKLIFGNVKRSGTDFLVSLKMLDVNRGAIETWVAETIPKRKADVTSFRSLAPVWVSKLTGKGGGGTLLIRANVAGAAVSLDGTRVGVTGQQAVTIADVAAGQHEVAVEKSGYTTTKQEFTLAAGQSLPLSLALSAVSVEVGGQQHDEPVIVHAPGSEPEPPSDNGSPHSLARVGFWVAAVGTVAAAALAVKYGMDVQQINSDLNQYRRFPCGTNSLCNLQGNQVPGLTDADKANVAKKTSEGNRDQTLQWVFVALAPPFAVAGAYLLYKGYLQSEGGTESGHTAANHGLRIFPTASASAGGIIAEFDF
jgi:hypothetical protein